MTLKTVPVSGVLYNADGSPAANAAIVATLTVMDTDGGIVVPSRVSTTTDANGAFTLNLWPNARGVNGSQYTVRAQMPGALPGVLIANLVITVPDSDPSVPIPIATIANRTKPDALSDAKAAMLAAQAFALQASGAGASAAAAAASQTAAAASAAAVAFIYPNTYSSAPTVRPDGTAIRNGDRYNNATDGYEYIHINGAWTNAASSAQAAAASSTQAAASSGQAQASATTAQNAQASATASAQQAQSYANAAATNAKFYSTIAAGVAGTTSGNTFGVVSGGSDNLSRPTMYQNNAGSAQLLFTILPASEFDAEFVKNFEPNVAYAICDANNNAVFIVYNDGSIAATDVTVNSLNGVAAAALQSIQALGQTAEIAAFSIADASGNVALEVQQDGTVHTSALVCDTINGTPVASFGSGGGGALVPSGKFSAELTYFDNTGQSLGEGSNGTVTSVQEFDNVGFPALSVSPTSLLTLTVANTQAYNPPGTGRGESPMYGALAMIKQRIAAEKGISYTQQGYQLAAGNNAIGGQPISAFVKGSSSYSAALSQLQSAYTIAQSQGRTCKAGAKFWTQGEYYTTGYQAALQQLASDWNADCKAVTGQSDDVILISYQTPTESQAAIDQLAAHDASPLIWVAGPIYQLNFYNDKHIDAPSSRLLGALYGLLYERVAINGETWEPLRILSITKQGAILNIRYRVPVLPLVWDTTTIPAQPNYGYVLTDSLGANIPINSVSLVQPDTVKIVASTAIAAGTTLTYACFQAAGRGTYLGSSGNLRDSQGNSLTFDSQRLDNWAVIESKTL